MFHVSDPQRWVVLALGVTLACGGRSTRVGSLEIRKVFAFAPVTREGAAVYFTIVNHGPAADTLLSARCACAQRVMLHGAGMTAQRTAAIRPGDSLALVPGGRHLMLESLNDLPVPGSRLDVTLTFARAGSVTIPVPVRPYSQ